MHGLSQMHAPIQHHAEDAFMCNHHSKTHNVDAIRRLFKIDPSNDRTGNLPPWRPPPPCQPRDLPRWIRQWPP